MKLLDKLEQKYAKYSISKLMNFIIFGKVIGTLVAFIVPQVGQYLILDPSEVMKGQVWRLLTFVFVGDLTSPINFLFELYFYFLAGQLLESRWGAFRLNLYYFTGVLAAIAAAFVFDTYGTDSFIYETLFFAIAVLFPDLQFYLFFFIPIKAKWLGIFGGVLLLLNFALSGWAYRGYMAICMLNFILFFGPMLFDRIKNGSRSRQFERKVSEGMHVYESPSKGKIIDDVPFHRCCVCGITEKDDPNMIFRYCSGCNGAYEYCSNHINNHTHHV